MPRRGIAMVIGVGMLLVLALAASPIFAPGSVLAPIARITFHGLCHQSVARSFVVDGHAMAICHRCSGIYAGIALGALAVALGLRVRSSSLAGWAIAALALGGHVALGWIAPELFDRALLRVASGVAFGAFAGAALATALSSLARASQPGPLNADSAREQARDVAP